MTVAKIVAADGRLLRVAAAVSLERPGAPVPGSVLEATEERLVVATGTGPVALAGLTDLRGAPVCPKTVASVGDMLPSADPAEAEAITACLAGLAPQDGYWRRRLVGLDPAELPQAQSAATAGAIASLSVEMPAGLTGDRRLAAIGAWAARISAKPDFDLAFADAALAERLAAAPGHVLPWAPLRFTSDARFGAAAAAFAEALAETRRRGVR